MQGDPQSQRSICNTLNKQVPLSRGTAEGRSPDAGGSAKPTLNQQHPQQTGPTFKGDGRGTQSRCRGIREANVLSATPSTNRSHFQGGRQRDAVPMQGDPRKPTLYLQHPPGSQAWVSPQIVETSTMRRCDVRDSKEV